MKRGRNLLILKRESAIEKVSWRSSPSMCMKHGKRLCSISANEMINPINPMVFFDCKHVTLLFDFSNNGITEFFAKKELEIFWGEPPPPPSGPEKI